ncbi:hypothetical protein MMC11_007922 [Xylographa trunciseda]|nr:hypothetical protein [Xylographa trunciseda]
MELFEAHTYPVECPCLPSFNTKPVPTNLEDDVKTIRSVLDRLIVDQGKDVIVALHSYGGLVGSHAADESLGKKARQSKGLPGGVLHLLYMGAPLMSVGDTLGTAFGGEIPPFITVEEDGTWNIQEPGPRFYNDLPKLQQDHWVSELRPQPGMPLSTLITYAAYMHHPVTYLFCEKDEAMPLEFQKMMVATKGQHFLTETCASGHSPFLSMPETVLKVVDKIAA